MDEANEDVQRLSPDKLMTAFSRSHMAVCLTVAVGLHLAVVAATSMTYVRDTWIDPEGAELRRAEADRRKQQALADRRRARAAARAAATQAATTRKARPKGRDDDVPDRARNSRTYRATTQAADPREIPTAPEDLKVPLD